MRGFSELRPDEREAVSTGSLAGVRAIARLSEHVDDEHLAELIESHAEARLASGCPVNLEMYLEAIPMLVDLPNALDAALEASMRSLAESSVIPTTIVDQLICQYPSLKEAILESASLTNSVLSASTLGKELRRISAGELPRDFGPALASGPSRYLLKQVLGAGASGQVFLAADRQLSDDEHEATVALKLFRGTTVDESMQQSLLDEALKMRRVEHPSVVRVLDAGFVPFEGAYIVAEYLSGGSLDQRLRADETPMPSRQAVEIMRRIALGLQAMHNAGVLHCDLKPSNIVLSGSGEPKIVDFGVAVRLRESYSPGDERAAAPIGNIAFMAPERFRMASDALTIRADLYALGGLLFHMLTGALPNGATLESARAFLAGETDRPAVRDPFAHATHLDRDLSAICRRSMAQDPSERHESAAAFADDLRDWLAKRPISWTRPSFLRRVSLWRRRRPVLSVTLVIAALAALAALFYVADAMRQKRESQMQAAIAEATKLFREDFVKKAILTLVPTIRNLRDRERTALLPMLAVAEQIYGAEYMDALGVEYFWTMRVPHFRKIVSDAESSWGEHDLRTVLWELGLGIALYRSGEIAEAARVLEHNESAWVRFLGADDPWVRAVGRIRQAAVAQVILGFEADRPLTDREHRTLEVSAALLAEALAEAEKVNELTDADRIALEVLAEIRGYEPLKDPEVVQRARALLDR